MCETGLLPRIGIQYSGQLGMMFRQYDVTNNADNVEDYR